MESVEATIEEEEFWSKVAASEVKEAIMMSWSGRRLLARLTNGRYVAVKEESDAEVLRNRCVSVGVTFRYPPGEAPPAAEYGSETATVAGIGVAAAVGMADTVFPIFGLEAGAALGGTGGAVELQSYLEGESPQQVLGEDWATLGKDVQLFEQGVLGAEKLVEADVRLAEQYAAQEVAQVEGAVGQAFGGLPAWLQRASDGVVANHAPGIGGIIEDSFMVLLVAVSLFSLWKQAGLKRKSNTWAGTAHTATGAMQIGIVIYAIGEERCLRESPGPVWAVFTFIIFMVNNLTMWPLLKYFKGPEVYRVLFKLAYSFIISFQGIHCIAFSSQYPWLYWLVMPFWYYSIKKLAEASDNIFALLPEGTIPIPGVQEEAKRRLKGITNDTPTLVYSILNFAGAVFDNLYMAVYTWRGPAGFWGWSQENIPGVNDHIRTALVKPAFGSLTISVLVFLGTLVYRKQMNERVGITLNIILASIGPWLILYYHKLIDFDEPWQPEIAGDWGSSPYFITHAAEFAALLAMPLAFMGSSKALAALIPSAEGGAAAAVAGDAAASYVGLAAPSEALAFDPLRWADDAVPVAASAASVAGPVVDAGSGVGEVFAFDPAGMEAHRLLGVLLPR